MWVKLSNNMVVSLNCNKSLPEPLNNSSKPFHNVILPTPPPYNPNNANRTTRPIRNRDLDEKRAKGLCSWCDKKIIPGHRC